MPDWPTIPARLKSTSHWRERLVLAEELMEAFQAGLIVEPTNAVRNVLCALAADRRWQIRKVIANDLAVIEDGVFDDLTARLCNDSNTFVRQVAQQSYSRRCKQRRNLAKKGSAQKQLSRQLQRLRERYGDEAVDEVLAISDARHNLLAGSMAHDIRSILTHLQPAAAALANRMDTQSDPAILKRKSARIVEGLSFMESCVADMERYTEPLPVTRHAEYLVEVLTVAHEMAKKNIEELGYDSHMVVLKVDVPDGLRLRVSRHLLILAVANLVKNAYESFMEKHKHLRRGEILVKAGVIEDSVEITISDNGMGISKGNLNELRLLVPRRRNKAKRRSTGFGVPIAHRYIEAHDGTLAYDSQEDVGTTVLITLPKNVKGEECS